MGHPAFFYYFRILGFRFQVLDFRFSIFDFRILWARLSELGLFGECSTWNVVEKDWKTGNILKADQIGRQEVGGG
jgi:hypothetical protein